MQLISAHKIEKSFAHSALFTNLSLGIEDKQRIGLVGPNGAGKSTLLKILSGQLDADDGTISKKKGLRIGFVEQTPEFEDEATILSAILEKCSDRDEALPRAWELMAKLSLSAYGGEHLVSELSGGWRKRLALARELAFEPELLLLDEPTNHLDVASILWLEEMLESAPFSLLMVTHDRLFLERVVNRVWDLDPRNANFLLNIEGSYSHYLEAKEIELATARKHQQVEKNRLRRETEWLHRGSLARQTKQKARIQAAGDLREEVSELGRRNRSTKVELGFGESEHGPKKLIAAESISKSFGGTSLFDGLDLLITRKTRLGLLGDNGCGKSTLIKVLLGMEPVDSGTVQRLDGLKIAYFEQSRETLIPDLSVLKNICAEGEYVFFRGQSIHVRSYLDRFHFSGVKAEMPVAKLSGGEQARLRLAQLMLIDCQILVLDEPTNDLDIDMLDSLESSLAEFDGALILVTHDRYFLDAVSNQILAFPVTGSPDRELRKFASYFQWENWLRETERAAAQESRRAGAAAGVAKKARLSFKEKFELENMEANILKLETELAGLVAESETLLTDHKRLADVHSRIASLQSQIEKSYDRWSELAAKS